MSALDVLKKKIKQTPLYTTVFYPLCWAVLRVYIRRNQRILNKKLTRIYQNNIRKIRVGFLVTENEKWSCQSLFDKLKKNSHFEPVIILSSLNVKATDVLREKFQKNLTFFKQIDENLIEAYDPQHHIFRSLKPYQLDIIFYQQPWGIAKEHNILSTTRFALPCYVPYCFEDGAVMFRRKFFDFHSLLFREYTNHSFIRNEYIRVGASKNHIKAVGWPKLEPYLDRDFSCSEKYVIYAPHHAVEADSTRLGTFAWNGRFLLQYAKAHPEFNWVFKPHPRCKISFLKEGLFKNRQELDDYYDQWAKLGSTCEEGNYIDLFKKTRCLITDCCSFLVEFLPTEQPLIHLKRQDDNSSSDLVKQIIDAYYPVYDLATLQQTLHTVLEKGEDPMRQARLKKIEQWQLVQPAAENIIRDLQTAFSQGVKKHV